MPGLVPGIHVFLAASKDMDGRRESASGSEAVLRPAKPGHDGADREVEPNFGATASRVELVCASG
jgi:hypothetical protein